MKISEVTSIRSVHLWRFNVVMKALHIILNDNFIKLALFASSPARRTCNETIHIPNSASDGFSHTVGRLPEISKQTSHPMNEYEAEIYRRDAKILGEVMYNRDDYFQTNSADLEDVVDSHIKDWVNLGQPVSR